MSHSIENNRIALALTYHPQNLAVKSVILIKIKILCRDPKTKNIFPLTPLNISFKQQVMTKTVIFNFLVTVQVHLSLTTNQELSKMCTHDAKLVLLLIKWARSQE